MFDPFVSRGRINTTQLASQVQGEKTSTAKFLKTPTITVILIPSAALATPAGGRFSRLEGELGCLIWFKVVSFVIGEKVDGPRNGMEQTHLFASTYKL